jgi:5-methylcytosine-specific restriction endonuclease McrA
VLTLSNTCHILVCMFEDRSEREAPLVTADLAVFAGALRGLHTAVDDAERIDQLRLLEELKGAVAAAQARVTADFAASQERQQREAGVPAKRVGRGIAAQVGLAKRESPARAQRYLGWSKILTRELPHTLEKLAAGKIPEWRAQLVARETAWLDPLHRRVIDEEIAPHLESWGDRRAEAEVKKAAYRLDPTGYLNRLSNANNDRTVTLRPAPDTMSYLTGLLPVAQGVAVLATLQRQADSLRSQGDGRSRGQIMADTLVERVTGQATAEAVPIEVNLVMSDQTMLNVGDAKDEPAHLDGYGPIPAAVARKLLLTGLTDADDAAGPAEAAEVWLRRLFTAPDTGQLAAVDSRRRTFDGTMRRLLIARDQFCRTPWCDAPIRHADHVVAVEDDGRTELANGQGLCEACNHAKQAPGWRARPSGGRSGEAIDTTTPTGHRYRSEPPDPPHTRRRLRLDLVFAELLDNVA